MQIIVNEKEYEKLKELENVKINTSQDSPPSDVVVVMSYEQAMKIFGIKRFYRGARITVNITN